MSAPQHELLAEWLRRRLDAGEAGAPPPDGLDPQVVAAVDALRPDLAAEPDLDVPALLDELVSGPLAVPRDGEAEAARELARWLDDPASPGPKDPALQEAVWALQPDRLPSPDLDMEDLLDDLSEGPFAEEPASAAGALSVDEPLQAANTAPVDAPPHRRSRRRWIWPALTLGAMAAGLLLVVGPGLSLRQEASPFDDAPTAAASRSEAAPGLASEEEIAASSRPRPQRSARQRVPSAAREQAESLPRPAPSADPVFGYQAPAQDPANAAPATSGASMDRVETRAPAPDAEPEVDARLEVVDEDAAPTGSAAPKLRDTTTGRTSADAASPDAPAARSSAAGPTPDATPEEATLSQPPPEEPSSPTEAETQRDAGLEMEDAPVSADLDAGGADLDEEVEERSRRRGGRGVRLGKKKSRKPAAAADVPTFPEPAAGRASEEGGAQTELIALRQAALGAAPPTRPATSQSELVEAWSRVDAARAAEASERVEALLGELIGASDAATAQYAAWDLARLQHASGRSDDALITIARGLGRSGGDRETRSALYVLQGRVLESRGDSEGAKLSYRRANSLR